MLESLVPEEFEKEEVQGPLDDRTVELLFRASEFVQSLESSGQLPADWEPGDLVLEIAARIGLTSALRRHSPGKPVTGAGGSPVVDWALISAPYRTESKDALERALPRTTLSEVQTFLKDLLSPLIMWVLDLPASESFHHSHPYGLLDHMFEVALAVLPECARRLQPADGLMSPWSYDQALRQSLILSLVHDIGKVFNVEVKDEKTGQIWDPMREPLAYFKTRHGIAILKPTEFRFLPGRGSSGHEKKGQQLLPLVIHPKIWKRMGPEISNVYEAYLGRHETPAKSRPAPLDFIADCVRRADGTSTAKSHARGSKPGEYLLELVANKALEA
jgi:hypothetical protein